MCFTSAMDLLAVEGWLRQSGCDMLAVGQHLVAQ